MIKELPAHSVFIANSDPNGGAVAVRVTQNGDYAAMQNYFDTVKPYDFSWRSAMGAWADGTARPDNITAALGQFGNVTIGSNEAGAVFFNWVLGSNDVKAQQKQMQYKAEITGGETFGVLTWDSIQNKYVTIYPNDTQSTEHSVSGTMPVLGQNQTAFFGMHTHPHGATPSNQDLKMTETLGLDQVVVGSYGSSAIFASNPSNNWQGQKFKFEGAREDSISGAGYGSSAGGHDPTGVGGVADGRGGQLGGNSGSRASSADGRRLIATRYGVTGISGSWLGDTAMAVGDVFGSVADFLINYNDMRAANTIGADKYFHCKANCQASNRGVTGVTTAEVISNTREFIDEKIKGDPAEASAADQVANTLGRRVAGSGAGTCQTGCSSVRPTGLDPNY